MFYSMKAVGSTALASASTSTCAAPPRFKVLAQASTVAPVVMTSSTTITRLPLMRPFPAESNLKAPATLRLRCLAVSPT